MLQERGDLRRWRREQAAQSPTPHTASTQHGSPSRRPPAARSTTAAQVPPWARGSAVATTFALLHALGIRWPRADCARPVTTRPRHLGDPPAVRSTTAAVCPRGHDGVIDERWPSSAALFGRTRRGSVAVREHRRPPRAATTNQHTGTHDRRTPSHQLGDRPLTAHPSTRPRSIAPSQ